MRVLALGGAGDYGRRAASILASSSLVSEIVIAGRNLEAARSCAKGIGEKATAASVDVSDRGGLAALLRDCQIVVNTTGPEYETVLKVLEAAISSGTNYCDAGADGPTTEAALELDSAAKARGVTALMGIGACPGIATLMMVHAARQLDSVEQLRSCALFETATFGITRDEIRIYRETKRLSAGWKMTMKWGTPPFHVYRGGSLVTVKERTDEMRITMPGYGEIPALLAGSPDAITIPRTVPGVRSVYTLLSWFPFELNGIYRELGGRVAKGELDESQAALDFLDQAVAAQERPQPASTGFPRGVGRWVEAVGTKDGKRTTYTCWPTPGWYGPDSTGVALAVAALRILSGEIVARGVLSPEMCLDPFPFIKDVARRKLKTDEPGNLLNEAWKTL